MTYTEQLKYKLNLARRRIVSDQIWAEFARQATSSQQAIKRIPNADNAVHVKPRPAKEVMVELIPGSVLTRYNRLTDGGFR